MEQLFVGPETARGLHAGPLGEQVDGFVETLRASGYDPSSGFRAPPLVMPPD